MHPRLYSPGPSIDPNRAQTVHAHAVPVERGYDDLLPNVSTFLEIISWTPRYGRKRSCGRTLLSYGRRVLIWR